MLPRPARPQRSSLSLLCRLSSPPRTHFSSRRPPCHQNAGPEVLLKLKHKGGKKTYEKEEGKGLHAFPFLPPLFRRRLVFLPPISPLFFLLLLLMDSGCLPPFLAEFALSLSHPERTNGLPFRFPMGLSCLSCCLSSPPPPIASSHSRPPASCCLSFPRSAILYLPRQRGKGVPNGKSTLALKAH